jgi:excisionase family DNA binding protein
MQEHLPLFTEAGDDEPDTRGETHRDAPIRSKAGRDPQRSRRQGTRGSLGAKKLLSVEEAALLLDTSRATLYRAIKRGDLPLPLFLIGRRLRIPRAAIERLLVGEWPTEHPSRPEMVPD